MDASVDAHTPDAALPDAALPDAASPDTEVLAISSKRASQSSFGGTFSGIGAILVTEDALIWHDQGTASPNDDHLGNASIQRMDLETGEITALVSGLDTPSTPLVRDDEALYYASFTHLHRVQLDGASDRELSITVDLNTDHRLFTWTAVDDFVYYARAGSRELMRHDAVSGAETAVFNAPLGSAISTIIADAGRLLVETFVPTGSTQLWALDPSDFTSEILIEDFRRADVVGLRGVTAYDGWLILSGGSWITRQTPEQSEPEVVVDSEHSIYFESIDDGFAYYVIIEQPSQSEVHYSIARAALSGGEPEILRRTEIAPSRVVAKGGTLYWAEDGTLLRAPL
jgi:hypothetical protein